MISEEYIQSITNEKALLSIQRDLKNALQGITSAIHYLHETSDYESSILDDIIENLLSAEKDIKDLIND